MSIKLRNQSVGNLHIRMNKLCLNPNYNYRREEDNEDEEPVTESQSHSKGIPFLYLSSKIKCLLLYKLDIIFSELSDFDLVMERLKRSKRRRKVEEDMQKAAKLVEGLISKMENAAEDDIRANSENHPAIYKLKMLNEVDGELRK